MSTKITSDHDMTLSQELAWRGFVNQTTFADASQLDIETRTLYFGVDPSADSMTVGNLAAAMMVRVFLKHEYKVILLVGGATGMIGDPDGKGEERRLKSLEEIVTNKKGIAAQYKTVFDGQTFELVDNYEWFKAINYLDFLREVGKHFSMTQLLDREFVQSRIGAGGKGISYAEFSYSLIQGYDFLHLYRSMGATLQVCGADQWGNSLSGVELIRKLEGAEAHVWSTPLIINKATGKKFGKSEAGAVWLDAAKTSVYQFYQFWLNADDAGVEDYLKVFTTLDRSTIQAVMDEFASAPRERAAQKRLALEVTKLVHGEARATSVQRVTSVLFGSLNVAELSELELNELAQEIPTLTDVGALSAALLEGGLAGSLSEARRHIDGNAVSVNGVRITEDGPLTARPMLIKRGKNGFCLVR